MLTTGRVAQPSAPCSGGIRVLSGFALAERLKVTNRSGSVEQLQNADLRWLNVLSDGFGHKPYLLEVDGIEKPSASLPLVLVESLLFGRFLVSLPYVSIAGPTADDAATATALVDCAAQLADDLDVKYLELRQADALEHPKLTRKMTEKVRMQLKLPENSQQLWEGFKSKLRNQIRKGQNQGFHVVWGREDLLPDFYAVFSRNMRDLGTPVYGRRFFEAILAHFPEAEVCCVRDGRIPIAAALVLHHGCGETTGPSASSLKSYSSRNANVLMYWELLKRTIERQQRAFDFGRSSLNSGTYHFKRQWGAEPQPIVWQYYDRYGNVGNMRPEHARYRNLIGLWKRLPLSITRLIGPPIVRGIP